MSGTIRAIVFDSNVFGKSALPNVDTISTWARACDRHNAELWIPEVVVWELAEHVLTEIHRFEATLSAHNRDRNRWGLQPIDLPGPTSLDKIIEVIEQAGGLIVPVNAESAITGLRDQVLVRGPASRRSGVKTGAADSTWLRDVYAHNDDSFEDIIIVTADAGAVKAVCESLGVDMPRQAAHLGEIYALLDEVVPADESQRLSFTAAVTEAFDSAEFTGGDLVSAADLGRNNWWDPPVDLEFLLTWEHQDSHVAIEPPINTIEELRYDPWSGSILGRIRIPVLIEEQYARQDDLGEAPEYRAMVYRGWVESDLVVYIDPDSSEKLVSDLTDITLGVEPGSVDSYLFD